MFALRSIVLAIATMALLTTGAFNPAWAGNDNAAPSICTYALVPIIAGPTLANPTGKDRHGHAIKPVDGDLIAKLVSAANDRAVADFVNKGIKPVDQATLTKALTGVDTANQQNWNMDTLVHIGQMTGADIVVFGVITGTRQEHHPTFGGLTGKEDVGYTTIQFWAICRDGTAYKTCLDGKSVEAVSRHHDWGVLGGTSPYQISAASDAVHNTLVDILEKYVPVTKTASKPGQ